jgi:hypothetical protein
MVKVTVRRQPETVMNNRARLDSCDWGSKIGAYISPHARLLALRSEKIYGEKGAEAGSISRRQPFEEPQVHGG